MFKGLGNLGNIATMMGSLQKLPERLSELNERMKQETVTASSNCGQVKITMNGTGQVQSVEISDGIAKDSLPQAIQDATNAAGAAAKQVYATAIRELATELELNLPGMDSLLTNLTGGQ